MKQRKKRVRITGIIFLLLLFYLIGSFIYYIFTLPIKNIIVKGNYLVTDKEIIQSADISHDSSLFKISKKKIIKNLRTIDLIDNVKIERDFKGTITIIIKEARALFYYVINDETVLSNKKTIKGNNFLGVPNLNNYVPGEIYSKFIEKFSNINPDIIKMISEIVYSADKYNDIIVDEERFMLRMNDGNIVYINIVNMEKINKYQSIFASVGSGGTLYLDSSSNNYIFDLFDEETKEEKKDKK